MAQYTQINSEALVTALTPINDSINEINTKIGNLTGALVWKGKFDTLPAVTDYEAGNVVGVGNKEYVLTVTGSTKTWEELGDEGSYLLKSTAEETYAKKTSIPTVNDPKVSVKMNGVEKGSFTLNQATAGEVDLGTVITAHQDISGKVDKTLNAKSLEAVTIYTDNTPEHMRANKAAINAYETNLQALGVDVSVEKAPIIPVYIYPDATGYIQKGPDDCYLGFYVKFQTPYFLSVDMESGEYTQKKIAKDSDTVSSNIFENYKVYVHRSLEAITINTSNSDADMAANKAAINAYIDNLKALGVDTTKGFFIPVVYGYGTNGYLVYGIRSPQHYVMNGVRIKTGGEEIITFVKVTEDGSYFELLTVSDDNSLNTTHHDIVGAINEVNTLAKSKGNGTITGVKMNGVSKGTSGVVDLGTVLTEHQSLKTINGKTITGIGNIEISAPSITVDASMSDTSTNPVQNKVIKAYIDDILGTISTQLAAI